MKAIESRATMELDQVATLDLSSPALDGLTMHSSFYQEHLSGGCLSFSTVGLI